MVRLADADAPTLIAAWETTHRDLLALAVSGSDAEWAAPTECPGWSVGDLVAHTSSIERLLLGEHDSPHEPDWAALPHAQGDLGRLLEVPVDLRRSWPRERVQEELADTIDRRLAALLAGPQQVDAEVPYQFGGTAPLGRVLRMRTFDCWAHEQDARRAVGRPGHLGSAGAHVTADRLLVSLPYVWGKRVAPPAGAVLRLEVTGPGVVETRTVAMRERAEEVPGSTPATVTVSLAWPDYVALSCGRVATAPARIDGDVSLGDRLISALSITP